MNKSKELLIEEEILQKIPVLNAFGVEVEKLSQDECWVRIPLEPNHNHKGTAFGGSLYAVSIAACYALLYKSQKDACVVNWDLVIAKGEVEYLAPVQFDFYVVAKMNFSKWEAVVRKLQKNQKPGRLNIKAEVRVQRDGPALCIFNGEFAFVPQ
ncbi:MAG: YiiD C-terminal domain-containing protein [Pseudobdellovibrionaceae bacterium]